MCGTLQLPNSIQQAVAVHVKQATPSSHRRGNRKVIEEIHLALRAKLK
jgi:hypothetical protein